MTAANQRRAFLDMIAASEGTSTSPITRNRGYDVIVSGVNGREIFTDYSDHPFARGRPPKLVTKAGLRSTASGRYQIMLRDWPHYKALLRLADFGPVAQDLYAIRLLMERGALPLIDAGRFSQAISRVRNLWASMPSAGYKQHENSIAQLEVAFMQSGGIIA